VKRRQRGLSVECKVNVVPIINVSLVVVLTLLVIAPFLTGQEVDVDLPQAAASQADDSDSIEITYTGDRRILVAEQVLQLEDLPEVLGRLFRETPQFIVAGEIVGCLVLQPLGGGAVRLRQMAVRADCRGRGLGSGLVAYAEAVARRHGCRRLVLHARAAAVGFYERLGYHAEGPPFIEVTIPHQSMAKNLDDKETP